MIKRKVIILFTLVVVLITLYHLSENQEINNRYECIMFNLNSEEFEEVIVNVKGILVNRVFAYDYAELKVDINDNSIPNVKEHIYILPLEGDTYSYSFKTNEYTMMIDKKNTFQQFVDKNNGYFSINLEYRYINDIHNPDKELIYNYGIIYISKSFNDILIKCYKEDKVSGGLTWGNRDGRVIASRSNIKDSRVLLYDTYTH